MFNKFYISKSNLINNVLQLKEKNPNIKLCAMVKANAYGVGVGAVVKVLNNYVDYFGVNCLNEAKKIKPLTSKKILITGALDYSKIDKHFSYTCNSFLDVFSLTKLNKKINIHLKINTGMNRYGISKISELIKCLVLIKKSKLNLEGVYTHFATTDKFVEIQLSRFNKFVSILKKHNFSPIIHTDNSHVFDKDTHGFDMARIGFNLYNNNLIPYKPVVKIETQITQINYVTQGDLVGYDRRYVATKKRKVAILPIGYADGFDMHYIGLKLTINGKHCTVLNICMDCLMLDITNTKLKKGDKVYILNSANPLSLYARYAHTSEYEVMCKFGAIRADRVIVN